MPPPHEPAHTRDTELTPGRPAAVLFVVNGCTDRSTVGVLCRQVLSLIGESGAVLLTCDVRELGDGDLVAIEVLARLGLTARRVGCALDLCGASDRLVELIALVGLQTILPVSEAEGSRGGAPLA